jgi:hypothetical protein
MPARIGRRMASPTPARTDGVLIANQYAVDTGRSFPSVGGSPAFTVVDRLTGRTDLMALPIRREFPPRARAFQALAKPIDGLLTPLAYGAAGNACYAICPAPPGPGVLVRPRSWPEAELLECVLRPIALVLEHLQARELTHRGIRLDNVFQANPGQPVVLGAAWTTPPAMGQPALFEPPYSGMCLPSGRGEGAIADDVYSLGVLLLCLCLGRTLLADLDETRIVRRKLELGSFAALAGDERLPPFLGDLVRGMLAEDPEHRPSPTMLLDPAAARGRRVAARPPRRAQRSITLGRQEVWNARSLAHAMATEPEQGLLAIRTGVAEHWLRRGLGDGQLATRLEELVHHRTLADEANSEPGLVMRAVAVIDPLAPLCWRGVAVWPDGIGTALAAARGTDPELVTRLEEMIVQEEAGNWATFRSDRCDFAKIRLEARQQHAWMQKRGDERALQLLTYLLNPLMPCGSPLISGDWVVRLQDLLPALEAAASRVDPRQTEPVDPDVAAFVAARMERRMDLTARSSAPEASCLEQLRVLAQLQSRFHPQPLPGLTGWIAARAEPALASWHNRRRRTEMAERLRNLVKSGYFAPMLALLEDPAGRAVDARETEEAGESLRLIDQELERIATGAPERAATAYRLGQEIAAGLGLAALASALAIAALG